MALHTRGLNKQLIWRAAISSAAAMCVIPTNPAGAQGNAAVSRQLLAALTRPLIADIDSVRNLLTPGNARNMAWLVRSKSVGARAEARFRGAVLRASGGREYASADSSAMVVSVQTVRLAGDSAEVYVDRSERSCKGGQNMITGAVYIYRFVLRSGAWHFVNRAPYVYWDPPPPPQPDTPHYGCSHVFEL
jgi:hypothetical protein